MLYSEHLQLGGTVMDSTASKELKTTGICYMCPTVFVKLYEFICKLQENLMFFLIFYEELIYKMDVNIVLSKAWHLLYRLQLL